MTKQSTGVALSVVIKRYWAEIEAFENTPHTDVAVSDAQADETFIRTQKEMIGLPARTADDALAALDWLVRREAELIQVGSDGYLPIVESLVTAIHGYLMAMGGRS